MALGAQEMAVAPMSLQILVPSGARFQTGASVSRWGDLLAAVEVSEPLDENAYLISFGPHFRQEVVHAMGDRLISVGLRYFDDFFEFSGVYPRWCIFKGRKVRR